MLRTTTAGRAGITRALETGVVRELTSGVRAARAIVAVCSDWELPRDNATGRASPELVTQSQSNGLNGHLAIAQSGHASCQNECPARPCHALMARLQPMVEPWQNPGVLGVNVRAPHVPLRSHRTAASAEEWFKVDGPKNHYEGGWELYEAAAVRTQCTSVSWWAGDACTHVNGWVGGKGGGVYAQNVCIHAPAAGGLHKLSGRPWGFKLFPNPQSVPERFWEQADVNTWGTVRDMPGFASWPTSAWMSVRCLETLT